MFKSFWEGASKNETVKSRMDKTERTRLLRRQERMDTKPRWVLA